MKQKKRVQVVFTASQWNLLNKLRGELGEGDSEIVRNIVLSWLVEKSFMSTALKNRIFSGEKPG
jgi:hypothetical protein